MILNYWHFRAGLGVLVVLLALGVDSRADDWPHWRGPQYNGISSEKGWATRWPAEGPKTLWKASVGIGFSSVAAVQGRVYTAGYAEEKETIYCLNVSDGKIVWQNSYDSDLGDKFFEGGPTATPTVDGDSVYTLSRWGDLFCFEAGSGKIRWSKNIQKEKGVRVPGWGFAGSPTILGDLLLLNVGEAGMALEKSNGKVVWNSANKDAGYSTPVPWTRGKETLAIFSSGKSFAAVDARTGKEQWTIPWNTQYGVNAADPILTDDSIFVCSGYGKGAALWKFGAAPELIWQNKQMRNQTNPSILLKGYLFGIDGDAGSRATLKCMELKSGNVLWSEPSSGLGSVMIANEQLIVLSEKGELMVAPATPTGFKPTARAQVLGGKCWTVPVLANAKLYCRNAAGDLACVDVSARP
ncbi:MAG TPA: PQQ-binding-like beta-propeller repeat protein [Candidatus Saccharimonadales bacterium]|nr:PQQ-binding-like beta-propeller repeat protein [Candidatus Saccharimonadales bacterium]